MQVLIHCCQGFELVKPVWKRVEYYIERNSNSALHRKLSHSQEQTFEPGKIKAETERGPSVRPCA